MTAPLHPPDSQPIRRVHPAEPEAWTVTDESRPLASDNNRQAEYRASLQAGLVSACVVGLTFTGLTAANHWLAGMAPGLWVLQMQGLNVQGIGSGAIATLIGFSFGITYRYAVRTDINPHLESGVVWAFSLTRGLTQLDIGLMTDGEVFPFLLLAIESVLLFVIARFILDQGMRFGWVQAYPLDDGDD